MPDNEEIEQQPQPKRQFSKFLTEMFGTNENVAAATGPSQQQTRTQRRAASSTTSDTVSSTQQPVTDNPTLKQIAAGINQVAVNTQKLLNISTEGNKATKDVVAALRDNSFLITELTKAVRFGYDLADKNARNQIRMIQLFGHTRAEVDRETQQINVQAGRQSRRRTAGQVAAQVLAPAAAATNNFTSAGLGALAGALLPSAIRYGGKALWGSVKTTLPFLGAGYAVDKLASSEQLDKIREMYSSGINDITKLLGMPAGLTKEKMEGWEGTAVGTTVAAGLLAKKVGTSIATPIVNFAGNAAKSVGSAATTGGAILAKGLGNLAIKGTTAAKTAGGAAVKKAVESIFTKQAGQIVARGVLPTIGLGSAVYRIGKDNDWKGALIDAMSGLATMVPKYGTIAGISGQVYNASRDVYKELYGIFPEDDPEREERQKEVYDAVKAYAQRYVDGIIEPIISAKRTGTINKRQYYDQLYNSKPDNPEPEQISQVAPHKSNNIQLYTDEQRAIDNSNDINSIYNIGLDNVGKILNDPKRITPKNLTTGAPIIVNKQGDVINNVTNNNGPGSSPGPGTPSLKETPWEKRLLFSHQWEGYQ